MEVWKPVPGIQDIEVSSLGRVKSNQRIVRKHIYHERLLSIKLKRGYSIVQIYRDGGRKNYFVHRLVMKAFVGENELPIDHINGIKTDNRPENLEYVTVEENIRRYVISTKQKYPIGVRPRNNKFSASIQYKQKEYHLGTFDTLEQASLAYEEAVINPDEIPFIKAKHTKKVYGGVYKVRNRYRVIARKDKKPVRLGSYSTKEEAQQVLDDWRNSL